MTTDGSPDIDYEDGATPRLQERMAANMVAQVCVFISSRCSSIAMDADEVMVMVNNEVCDTQERQLDALHAGVTRLKNAAQATNDEVTAQNMMLDSVAVNVQDTEAEVAQQTERARKVARRHRELCVYYIVIVLLAVALIVILII